MKVRELKKRTESSYVVISIKCDTCGKESGDNFLPSSWHEFDSQHSNWGDDSGESYEHHDICSPKCYIGKIEKLANELQDYPSAVIDGFKLPFIWDFIEAYKEKK